MNEELKHFGNKVAPHVGAWIEMKTPLSLKVSLCVAPHVGAWIEILQQWLERNNIAVAPHVGAWIEITKGYELRKSKGSHPTWVRGLKWLLLMVPLVLLCRTPRGCVD